MSTPLHAHYDETVWNTINSYYASQGSNVGERISIPEHLKKLFAEREKNNAKEARYNQKAWAELIKGIKEKSPEQKIAVIEGISIPESPEDAELCNHYQYGEFAVTKLEALTQLNPKPDKVIFLPTGELHRHNAEVDLCLSKEDALAFGKKASQDWIKKHQNIARLILEPRGIEVVIADLAEGLDSEDFKKDHERTLQFYEQNEVFKNNIEKLRKDKVARTLKRIAHHTITGQEKNPLEDIQKIQSLFEKKKPSSQDKKNGIDGVKPILGFFIKHQHRFFEETLEVQALINKAQEIVKNQIPEESVWSDAQNVFNKLYAIVSDKYMKCSKDYLLEESALSRWMSQLAGKDYYSLNTYKDGEQPAFRLAADKLFQCSLPFIPYKFEKVKQQPVAAVASSSMSPQPESMASPSSDKNISNVLKTISLLKNAITPEATRQLLKIALLESENVMQPPQEQQKQAYLNTLNTVLSDLKDDVSPDTAQKLFRVLLKDVVQLPDAQKNQSYATILMNLPDGALGSLVREMIGQSMTNPQGYSSAKEADQNQPTAEEISSPNNDKPVAEVQESAQKHTKRLSDSLRVFFRRSSSASPSRSPNPYN